MGTPHMTKVIKDNKLVFAQYGQWDGHANVAGSFIKDFLLSHEVDEISKMFDKITLSGDAGDFFTKQAWFGLQHDFSDIESYKDSLYSSCNGDYVELCKEALKKFEPDRVIEYFMKSRDTGYEALAVLETLERLYPDRKIPVFISDYDTGREYIINLDDKTFTIIYLENKYTYPLSALPDEKTLDEIEGY